MDSMGHITTLPRNSNTKLLITTAARELASAKATLAVLRAEMDRLGAKNLIQRLAKVRRAAFGGWIALGNVLAGLIHRWINLLAL